MSDNLLPRIPVTELFSVVEGGCTPVKTTENEPFPIRATVFREGHDVYAAEAMFTDPKGKEYSRASMNGIAPGPDRYEIWVMPNRPGGWGPRVDSQSDPYATWRHDAAIKVDVGVDVDLMPEEGARFSERAVTGTVALSPTQEPLSPEETAALEDAAAHP